MAPHQGSATREAGFTLIELLVTMIIIAILSAIAIPIYLGQQAQASNTTTKHDLTNAKLSLVAYSVDNGGAYTTDASALRDYGFETSRDVTFSEIIIVLGGEDFCIEAAAKTGTWFNVTEKQAVEEGTCP